MFRKIKQIGYNVLKKYKSKKYRRYLKENAKHVNLTEIINDLKSIGIKQGDIILLHSSLKSIGYVEKGPNTVINAILKVIGSKGTLAVPTYPLKGSMYKTCTMENYIFDYKRSPTSLGAIPSAFLKLKGIYRSIHPTHSISAIGKFAKDITEKHHIGNMTYGKNSPWAKILELNGKILGIGVSLHPNAQYHYVEDIMGDDFPIKVKVNKIYKLKCKIDNNKYIDVEVQPLDPEVAKTRIDQKENSFIRDYFWEIYEKLGILHIGNIGESRSWWVNAKEFYETLMKLAKLGITIYSTEEELKNNNLYPFHLIKNQLDNNPANFK